MLHRYVLDIGLYSSSGMGRETFVIRTSPDVTDHDTLPHFLMKNVLIVRSLWIKAFYNKKVSVTLALCVPCSGPVGAEGPVQGAAAEAVGGVVPPGGTPGTCAGGGPR